MKRRIVLRGFFCLLMIAFVPAAASAQPQTVPFMADHPLDDAAYVALAKEWKAYIDSHGESADALVNLGIAYEYSGEREAAFKAAERAVELEPDHAKALYYYGALLFKHDLDREKALRMLERSRELDPDFGRTLTMLTLVHMQRGDLEEADKLFKNIHARNIVTRPLQDLAYNMLAGLPSRAVLITNGDNDTFPLLALQAGMNFRKDVIVINRHLLNLDGYREAFFGRHAHIAPARSLVEAKNQRVSPEILEELVAAQRVPVYMAITVNATDVDFKDEWGIEGLNFCTGSPYLTPEKSARLFLDTYRLDSATDWSFAWDLKPAYVHLMTNYVTAMYRLADTEGVTPETRRRLIEKALRIAEFHTMDRLIPALRRLQK